MSNDPLITVKSLEKENEEKIVKVKAEIENKLNKFIEEKEKILAELDESLSAEKSRIREDYKKKTETEKARLQAEFKAEIKKIESINQAVIDDLAKKLASKIID